MTTTTAVPSSDVSDFLFNVQKLDEVITSGATQYTDRLGVQRSTAAGAMARFAALNPRGAWATATVYQPRDLVLNSGTWYIALDTHTSGATFAGDLAAHWRPEQGVTRADLASTASAADGDALVGVKQPFASAVARTQHNKNAEMLTVADFGAVADGNGSTGAGTGISAVLQSALDELSAAGGGKLVIPPGVWILDAEVTVHSNIWLCGSGMYVTFLISRSTYNGTGLLRASGSGGPPTILSDFALLGPTSSGAGSSSVGLLASSNAVILRDIWAGGFKTIYKITGTDIELRGCWADVPVSGGTGYQISNAGNSLIDCTDFGCYVGVIVDNAGGENDPTIQIIGHNNIASFYSGYQLLGARNVQMSACCSHSSVNSRFTQNGIYVLDGDNIAISGYFFTLGGAQSTTCIGISQDGTTTRLGITDCSVTGALEGIKVLNAIASRVDGNDCSLNTNIGIHVVNSAGTIVSNNVCKDNGNATGYGLHTTYNFYIDNSSGNVNTVTANRAMNTLGTSGAYTGFFVTCGATSEVLFNNNVADGHGSDYSYTGSTKLIRGAENFNDLVPVVASAGALVIPGTMDIVVVTGTTNITSIDGSGQRGRKVTLIFTGALTVTDGSNLKLNGNFVTTADDTLTLVYDGANWFEVARSAN